LARLFITNKEIAFIASISNELVDKVNAQEVKYYAISLEHSNPHRLYNEEINKVWMPAVKTFGMVNWDNPNTVQTIFGSDSQFKLEVEFFPEELTARNLVPKEGDFIEYGQVFFEITSVTQPRSIYGQINNKVMTKCTCVPSREGQFQAGSNSSENVDNTQPIENKVCVDS
jgi:hypothetical protein